MRIFMMVAALLATAACNRGATANTSSTNASKPGGNEAAATAKADKNADSAAARPVAQEPTETAASMPDNFPGEDLLTRGSECIVYLGLSRDANSTGVGFDDVAMSQAQDQWESALSTDPEGEGWRQMVGSSVNALGSVPAAQRDAASGWCVRNAPEVDPEG